MLQTDYQYAMKFAGEKHSSQKMQGSDANYLLHISNVAMEVMVTFFHSHEFNIITAIKIAILHDTLEDTNTTFDELVDNFGHNVAIGVQALTKLPDETKTKMERMEDLLNRILELDGKIIHEVAIVKMCDRITNLQEPPKSWSQTKINKYFLEANLIHNKLGKYHPLTSIRLKKKIDEYNKKYVKRC